MNLMSTIAAPTLDRDQDEIGLLLEAVGSTRFDRFERTLGGRDDATVRAGARNVGNGLDDAEVSVIGGGVIGGVVRGIVRGFAWAVGSARR